jgi:hypothetical protein
MKTHLPGFLLVLSIALLSACETQPAAKPAAQAAAPAPAEPKPHARERAIEAGLAWLAKHQLADGSWRASGVDAACNAAFDHGQPKAIWIDHYDAGSTALGILAFVRAGDSSAAVTRALDWLRSQQNEQGFFSRHQSFLYNEALATLALVEHYAATKDAKELEPAQRGIDFLVRAQRPSPAGEGAWGWRYSSRMEIEQKFGAKEPSENDKKELFDSDVSITGWAVAALVTAERAGLKVDPAALKGAAEFVRWCRARDGLVGYNDPRNAGLTVQGRDDHYLYHVTCMSSIALRMALELDSRPEDDFVEPAAKRIALDAPTVSADGLSVDYYYWLNGTLALASYDGARQPHYFQAWSRALKEALLGLQEQKLEGCGRGGWLVPDRWSYAAGPVYTTAMALLALEQKG